MDSQEDATQAIKALNGRDVKGRRMKVEMSTGVGRDDRRSQTTQKLFVGNVADGTTDQQLRALFEPHITVVEADVIENKNFGFVHVDLGVSASSRDGRNKLDEVFNLVGDAELNGNRLRIQKSEGGRGGDSGGRGVGGFRGGFDSGRGGYNNRGRGGFDRGYDRNYGGGPPRGRGGRGARRDAAPYHPRGGGGYNSSNNSRGYDDGGFRNDYRDDYGGKNFGDYGSGGSGGGPMRGSSYGGDRDGGYYNSYGGQGGGGGYQDQMYSRRSEQEAPQQPQGYGTASYGGGQGGYSSGGYSTPASSSYFSAPPPQQQQQQAYPPSYPPAAPAHGYG